MTEKLKTVTCGECQDFEHPIQKIPNRVEAGKCKSFETGKAKTKKKDVIDRAYFIRGNCPFLYCTRRHCEKFVEAVKQ